VLEQILAEFAARHPFQAGMEQGQTTAANLQVPCQQAVEAARVLATRFPSTWTHRRGAAPGEDETLEDDGRIDLQEALAIAGAIVSGVMRLRA